MLAGTASCTSPEAKASCTQRPCRAAERQSGDFTTNLLTNTFARHPTTSLSQPASETEVRRMKIAGSRKLRRDVGAAGTSCSSKNAMRMIAVGSSSPQLLARSFFVSSSAGRSSVYLILLLLILLSKRTILSDCLVGDGSAAAEGAQDCGNEERIHEGGPDLSRSLPQQNFVQHSDFQQQHRRLQQQEEHDKPPPAAAASFLGHSVTYHPPPAELSDVASTVHCVGENYRPDAWMYRSCQFRNLCWDSTAGKGEFFLFASAEEAAVLEQLQRLPHPEFVTISSVSSGDKHLSLGSIHDPSFITAATSNKSKWYPTVVTDPAKQKELLAQGYYQLPSDTVLFPLQPSTTPVQVWDDFFAIYTVLSGFAWEDKKLAVLVSGDANSEGDARDTSYLTQLGPALGISASNDHGLTGSTLELKTTGDKRSNLVCAKYAAAGLGMIAATRHSAEGLSPREQLLTHAVGRGGVYYVFRAFLLNKMNAGDFNEPSPDAVGLAVGTETTREQVVAAFQNLGEFRMQFMDPKTAEISQQAQFAATTKICIAEMADPSTVIIMATFLPHESVLLVFESGQSDGVDERERRHVRDLLELMGHFRLHWLRSANDIGKIIRKESDALGLTLSS